MTEEHSQDSMLSHSENSTSPGGTVEASEVSSLHKLEVHFGSISYALNVLTFESTPPTLLARRLSPPVYAHHVVLCPLGNQTIAGSIFTRPFVLPPSMVYLSKQPLGEKCCLSATCVPMLNMEQFLSEASFRREYGIVGELQWQMIRTKVIPCPVKWKTYSLHPTGLPLNVKAFHFMSLKTPTTEEELIEEATNAYCQQLMSRIAFRVHKYAPIYID